MLQRKLEAAYAIIQELTNKIQWLENEVDKCKDCKAGLVHHKVTVPDETPQDLKEMLLK
jgi:hypothetical protein